MKHAVIAVVLITALAAGEDYVPVEQGRSRWRPVGLRAPDPRTEMAFLGVTMDRYVGQLAGVGDSLRHAWSGSAWELRALDLRYISRKGLLAQASLALAIDRDALRTRRWAIGLGGGYAWHFGRRTYSAALVRFDLPELAASLVYDVVPFQPLPLELYAWAGFVQLTRPASGWFHLIPWELEPLQAQYAAGVRFGLGWWFMRNPAGSH